MPDSSLVILVDDDPALLNALAFSFELEGFRVVTCEDAQAVLDLGDLPERSCLVLDQKMPGMSGLELLEALRARQSTPPALLITTSTPSVRRLAETAGVEIVEKPLLSDQLIDRVRALIDDRGHPRPRLPLH